MSSLIFLYTQNNKCVLFLFNLLAITVMSTDSSKLNAEDAKRMFKTVRQLENQISKLKAEDKHKDYCINHLKAEIRLLRDTLSNIQGASKEALYNHEAMNERFNTNIENGTHMNHSGDEIHYVG